MIVHTITVDKGACIIGEDVINMLTGEKYKFYESLSQELHMPIRLIEDDRRKLLLR